ncbi:unnamed protein product, partial [Prorocentrum cordatum]
EFWRGMDWAFRGLQAVAPLAPYLLPPRCPDCSCVADCSVPTEIVGLLGRQLDRCGPEQLTCPVCPGCPEVRCPAPGPALGAFAAGAAIGALTTALVGAVWRLRRPTALQAGRPALEDDELLLALDAGGPAAAPASEAQVAIDFFDDPNGFLFHVRVLLVPAGAGKWIWVTPDHSVQFGDLTTHRVVPLPRNSPFPRRLAGQLYAFDPFEEGELEAIREQAAALAAVLGIDVPRGAAAAPPRWVVADPAHPQFGQVIDAAISGAEDRFVRRGAVALAMLDGNDDDGIFTACENVPEERHQLWLDEKHSGPGRDPRVCPLRRIGPGGPRRATLDQAIEAHRPQDVGDWVFRGPKSLPEFLDSVRASGLGIAGYANHYITSSGVPPGSAAAHEIRLLLEALRHLIEYDQVDVTNLAGAELIARRIVQMQRAIRRDPKHPNYSGLEDMLASALDETGGVVTSKFDEWVAQEQKTKAGLQVAKDQLYGRRIFAHNFVSKGTATEDIFSSLNALAAARAFQELLKSSNIYSEEGRLTVRPFVQDKVSLLQGSVEPREALDLVPDHVRQVLMEPEKFLERHSDELADEPHIEPYWDPLLNPRVRANHPRLLALLKRLADMGIVVATRRKKATVGLFFVEKKGDRLRMIVDGRQPNQYHRLPPQTSMASVEALASVQVGADWRRRCSMKPDEAALYAATVDLKDGFHQFKIPHLSEWFVFDMPGVQAKDLGVHQVYDGDAKAFVDVAPDDYVWPAYGGLAMGWSWALWICHETLAQVMRSSAGPRDAMVLDKAPAAQLEPGMVGDLPYVDNANIIGIEQDLVQDRLERMTAALDQLGLKWHERQGAGIEVEILGVIVDGVQGLVRPKPKRLWRLHGGLTFLLRWRKAAGWQIRAVLGHLVSFFQLMRPGLSIFRVLYDFVQQDLGEIRELPTAALHELKVARSLLFMAVGRWGLPPCPVAFMTDASMKGYALLETDARPGEVRNLCRFRERARFSRREKFVEREHDGFKGSMAIGDAGEGWWDGLLERSRARGPVPERCRVEVDSGWRPPPLPDDFVDPGRWELVVAGAWRDASRVHDCEARCGLMGLARAASHPPYHDTELLSAGDNMGSVLAFEKGRAANRELLSQCRRAAALQLASGIVWRQRHVEGVRNAADYMSRAADRGLLQPGQVWRGPRGQVGQRPRRGRRFFLEIFSGEGYLTGAILEAGLRAGVPMDLVKGPQFDITDPKVQRVVIGWIRSGAIWLMHLATPCTRWSIARSSGTAEPAGGLAAARFTVRLIQECRRSGVHFTLENPQRSRLWTWRPLARALRASASTFVDLCQCRFGTPFQKPTRLAASHPLFASLARECRCRRRCEVLQGKVLVRGRWEWKTSLAAAYPPSLCRAYASAAQLLAPPAAARPDGEAYLERRWERQLASACGCSSVAVDAPRCPLRYRLPWHGCQRRWATAARYSDCVEGLHDFVACNGGSLSDPRAADATLERYFESLFLGGEAKANARWCLYGLAWQQGWATKGDAFPKAKQALKGWDRLEPPGSREPAVWEAVLAVADDLIGRDFQSTLAGALLPVAFDGYLRPSEALGLRGADVLRPPRSGPQKLWAVTVAPATQPIPSKTNTFDDTVFLGSAAKGQGFVGSILDILLARAGPGPLFAGLTLAQLEAAVNAACRRLQLPVAFTPHCLRHGGASRDALEKFEDLRSIQRRGRWKARESVRRYEK